MELKIGDLRVVQVPRAGVAPDHAGEHHFFQVGTLDALLEARYDGDMSVRELREHGTHGIGTLDALDGEVVLIDGLFFQMTSDGTAHPVDESRRTPFALVTFFEPDAEVTLAGTQPRAAVEAAVARLSASAEDALAIRIDGRFVDVTARSAVPERRPYRPFPEAIAENQRIFQIDDLSGTMIGFRFPQAAQGVQVPGFHLHLIDAQRTRGGHVLDYEASDVTVAVQRAGVLQIELPVGVEAAAPGLTDQQLQAVHAAEG